MGDREGYQLSRRSGRGFLRPIRNKLRFGTEFDQHRPPNRRHLPAEGNLAAIAGSLVLHCRLTREAGKQPHFPPGPVVAAQSTGGCEFGLPIIARRISSSIWPSLVLDDALSRPHIAQQPRLFSRPTVKTELSVNALNRPPVAQQSDLPASPNRLDRLPAIDRGTHHRVL